MPTNLPVEWFLVNEEYEKETDPKKKAKLLEKLIAATPKHKGCENLLSNLKQRLSKLKKSSTKKRRGGGGGLSVRKEGAAQVVLLGFPNSGKSSLLKALTNTNPLISQVPFSTRTPQVGTMKYLNVQIQVVEVPAIIRGGAENQKWLGIARNADLIVLVIDSTNPKQSPELKQELFDAGIHKNELVVYTKKDLSKRGDAIDLSDPRSVEDLKRRIWKSLGLIRVYTRTRFVEPDLSKPVTLKEGSTVIDLAKEVHKDFARKLKHARVWRGKFKGLRAGPDYGLKDGDIIELVI